MIYLLKLPFHVRTYTPMFVCSPVSRTTNDIGGHKFSFKINLMRRAVTFEVQRSSSTIEVKFINFIAGKQFFFYLKYLVLYKLLFIRVLNLSKKPRNILNLKTNSSNLH